MTHPFIEKIREALEKAQCCCNHPVNCPSGLGIDEKEQALAALASLEKAGEGEAIGDYTLVRTSIESIKKNHRDLIGWPFFYDDALLALERLLLRAALSDEERKKIKRETLDFAVFRITNRPRLMRRITGDPQEPPEIESNESEEFEIAMRCAVEIIEQLKDDLQLAELEKKEEGK